MNPKGLIRRKTNQLTKPPTKNMDFTRVGKPQLVAKSDNSSSNITLSFQIQIVLFYEWDERDKLNKDKNVLIDCFCSGYRCLHSNMLS